MFSFKISNTSKYLFFKCQVTFQLALITWKGVTYVFPLNEIYRNVVLQTFMTPEIIVVWTGKCSLKLSIYSINLKIKRGT